MNFVAKVTQLLAEPGTQEFLGFPYFWEADSSKKGGGCPGRYKLPILRGPKDGWHTMMIYCEGCASCGKQNWPRALVWALWALLQPAEMPSVRWSHKKFLTAFTCNSPFAWALEAVPLPVERSHHLIKRAWASRSLLPWRALDTWPVSSSASGVGCEFAGEGSNFGTDIFLLYDLTQVPWPLWASVSSSVKWE